MVAYAVAAKYGKDLYDWYGSNNAAMAETDRKVAELFSQDMSPARHLPIICAYWMIIEGEFWYVTHDDISLGELASTYLPVDKNVEHIWNKRMTELWDFQPSEFQFMATNYGLKNNPNAVESNGLYWGPLPNGVPVKMSQESIDIASYYCDTIQNFTEDEIDKIAAPHFNFTPEQLAAYDAAAAIGTKSAKEDSNFWWWALGITGVLVAGGGGYYAWRRYND